MSWAIVAVAGAGLVTGAMSSEAAGDAADTQAGATRDANAVTQKQYEQTRSDLAPYRDAGKGASSKLSMLLGTGDQSQMEFGNPAANAEVNRLARERARQRAIQQVAQSWGTPDAQTILNNPAGLAEIERLTQVNDNDHQEARQQVNTGWGNPGVSSEYGSLLKNFTGEDLQNEPGYQFGLSEGYKGLDRTLARGGKVFSGEAIKAGQRFGNDYASTKFGDAFNRDSANKTRTYNFLSGNAGLGENAAAQTGNAGATMAGQVGANTTAMGNALGASQIAQGNAWGGAVQNGANAYQQNELMNKLLKGNTSWGGSSGGSVNSGAYGFDGSNGAYWN